MMKWRIEVALPIVFLALPVRTTTQPLLLGTLMMRLDSEAVGRITLYTTVT